MAQMKAKEKEMKDEKEEQRQVSQPCKHANSMSYKVLTSNAGENHSYS